MKYTGMASLLLTAVLSTGVLMAQEGASPSSAQDAPQATQATSGRQHRHPMNPDKAANHLAKKLGLTADQVAQIKPILVERQNAMQSLRADASLSQQDRRAKAKAIVQDSQSKIEAVLNDTQKQQFEQMIAARRARHGEKHAS